LLVYVHELFYWFFVLICAEPWYGVPVTLRHTRQRGTSDITGGRDGRHTRGSKTRTLKTRITGYLPRSPRGGTTPRTHYRWAAFAVHEGLYAHHSLPRHLV